MHAPPLDRVKIDGTSAISSLDDHRAPKRPWEDMSQDTSNVEGNSFQEVSVILRSSIGISL